MTNQESDFPADLLEKSLQIKSAARQLIEEQLLNSNSALNYSLAMFKTLEERDEKHKSIITKPLEQRSATELLYLRKVAYEHAKTCENYDCEFGMECWRMKGLQYQTNKLKEQNRLTPASMVKLWIRQIEIESHASECKNPIKCKCSFLENYKYLFMKLKSDLRTGKVQPIPKDSKPESTDKRAVLRYDHPFVPVFHYFDDQTKEYFTKASDPTTAPPPRSYHLLTAILQETYKHKKGDAGEFVKEQMLESIAREMYVKERYEKEKAARPGRKMMGRLPNGKMVELIPGRNGKLVPIGAPMDEDVARCGPSTSTGVPKRMVEEKKTMMMKRDVLKKEIEMMQETKRKMKEELEELGEDSDEDEEEDEEENEKEVHKTFDPSAPGTSTPAAKPCDHSNCNCVLDEKEVDVFLATKQELVPNTTDRNWNPSESVEKAIKKRVARLSEKWGKDKPLTGTTVLSTVRIATLMIKGQRYTVAYNADVHNNFPVARYNNTVLQYMFAAKYYPDVCMIIINFVNERKSEGEQRMKAMLSECGLPILNLNYTREMEKTSTMRQFIENWNALIKGKYAECDAHARKKTAPPVERKETSQVEAPTTSRAPTRDERNLAAYVGGMEAMAKRGTSKAEKEALLSQLKTKEAIDYITNLKFPMDASSMAAIPAELREMLKTYIPPVPYTPKQPVPAPPLPACSPAPATPSPLTPRTTKEMLQAKLLANGKCFAKFEVNVNETSTKAPTEEKTSPAQAKDVKKEAAKANSSVSIF
ncbi:hypothetical protein PRIPAC_91330 [Pristionchus pacificus]|uniref:Uncharacterized protein n=1 Tax=Pristionchus pacificus TaxID=54126 RepID=A0A2A6B9Q9_PRIPA|nr:hypothetical protein PRIPAC_91330 [Pristionchus pacificus]|eukprot:PDM62608.1 hypothetical protein PRIPAC_52050 [Pristionchus pacificus]